MKKLNKKNSLHGVGANFGGMERGRGEG